MKNAKKLLKPLYVVPVLLGIGCLAIVEHLFIVSKCKSRHKYISKINNHKNRLHAKVFNPYRIGNGIRPQLQPTTPPNAEVLEGVHKMIMERRKEKKQ